MKGLIISKPDGYIHFINIDSVIDIDSSGEVYTVYFGRGGNEDFTSLKKEELFIRDYAEFLQMTM